MSNNNETVYYLSESRGNEVLELLKTIKISPLAEKSYIKEIMKIKQTFNKKDG